MINWLASWLPDDTSSLSTLKFFSVVIAAVSVVLFLIAAGFVLAKYLDGNVVTMIITGFVLLVCGAAYLAAQARTTAIEAAQRLKRGY